MTREGFHIFDHRREPETEQAAAIAAALLLELVAAGVAAAVVVRRSRRAEIGRAIPAARQQVVSV